MLKDENRYSDELVNLFVMVSAGVKKAFDIYKETPDHFSDISRELAGTKSDLDSLIRIVKLKHKEMENELMA